MLCSHFVADNAHFCREQRALLSRTTRTSATEARLLSHHATSLLVKKVRPYPGCSIQESTFTTDIFTIVRQSQIAIANKVAPTRSHLSCAHMCHAVMVDWAYAAMNMNFSFCIRTQVMRILNLGGLWTYSPDWARQWARPGDSGPFHT